MRIFGEVEGIYGGTRHRDPNGFCESIKEVLVDLPESRKLDWDTGFTVSVESFDLLTSTFKVP